MVKVQEIELPPPEEWGPALAALGSDERRRFVIGYVQSGAAPMGRHAILRAAGYKGADPTLRVTAHHLMRDETILRAIREESSKYLNAAAPVAINTILTIAADPTNKDAYKAASDILDRIGYPKTNIQQHEVTVKDDRSNQDLIEMIRQKVMELSERGVALPKPQVIEGEVVEAETGA